MTPAEEHLSIPELHILFRYENGKLYNRITRNSRAVIGAEVGSDNGKQQLQVQISKKQYYVHRIIWAMHNDRWPENQIDHIDRNKINNKIENLRDITSKENNRNTNSFEFAKGYYKDGNKYRAYVMTNEKRIYSKRVNTEEEAVVARQDLKNKYY